MFLSEWREFPSAPSLEEEKKKNLMTARVSMLLKLRAYLICFRASFLPGRAKDLSAPRYTDYFSLFSSIIPETFKDITSISSLKNSSKS